MHKIILGLIFALSLASPLSAAPCQGTKMPEQKKIFLGLQNHTIVKQYLKDSYGKLRSSQNFLLLSYGVFDWLSLDLKGGVGNIKQHPAGSDEIDYPSYLGGGYGFRVKFYDARNLKMVFGFQHVSIHPETIFLGAVKHKAVLDDWQFCTAMSYDLKKITPYLGIKWSKVDYIHWVDGERKRQKSDLTKSIGLVSGFDLALTKNTWLNLEGQFLDNEAVVFSINYSF